MHVKDSIFSSNGEERGYRSIESTWGEKHMVCGQTPLSALLEPGPNWKRDTSILFFKTSVDYVVCTATGRPLIAIDFDGMGEGFSAPDERKYMPSKDIDRSRKTTSDIKIRHTKEAGLPYYIVGSEEFDDLGGDVRLTVIDGIIGATLARQAFRQYSSDGYVLDFLPDRDYEDPFDMELECNPIPREQGRLRAAIDQLGGGLPNCSYIPFEVPALPTSDSYDDIYSAAVSRARAWNTVERWGCTAVFVDTPFGEVSASATIRNIDPDAHSIVREIAELLALRKLLNCYRDLSHAP